MKVLLTDGKGFFGSNFIDMFGKKYDLYIPEDDEEDFAQVQGADHMFDGEKYDAVVHVVQKTENDADALVAFKNVQYAAVSAGVKKMIVVLDAALPPKGSAQQVREDSFDVQTPLFADDLSRYFIPSLAAKDKISTVLRVFGAYGKGMPKSEITQMFACALSGKKPITMPADKTFSAVYIDDVCKIVSKFLENDYEKGIYHVAAPDTVTYADFAKKAKAYAKKAGREVAVVKSDKSERELSANVDKLLGALGSFKFTTLTTGVNKTLDYYNKHKSQLK